MFKKSINQWTVGGFAGEVGVVDSARTVKGLGFDAIEPCFGAGDLTPETREKDIAGFRSEIEGMGLEISSLATGGYWSKSLSSPDPSERAEALEFSRAYIRAANLMGVDAILVVPGAVAVPWDDSRPVVPARIASEMSAKSIHSLVPMAEDLGVTLCLENVWNRFLTGPFEFSTFVDSFESPHVKAYFDVGNVLLYGYPEHWIEILGAQIGRVHVKNFKMENGAGTLNNFTGSLLEGDVNWEAVFRALKMAGYDGYLTAEVLISEKGLPDNDLAAAVSREMSDLIERYG
jgi:hexulose-6-phosphate isomerase